MVQLVILLENASLHYEFLRVMVYDGVCGRTALKTQASTRHCFSCLVVYGGERYSTVHGVWYMAYGASDKAASKSRAPQARGFQGGVMVYEVKEVRLHRTFEFSYCVFFLLFSLLCKMVYDIWWCVVCSMVHGIRGKTVF